MRVAPGCLICLVILCGNLFAPSVAAPIIHSEPTVTLVAVGDILLDRGVAREIERHGTDYPFAHVEDILTTADIAFGNLESPLTKKCDEVQKRFRFRANSRYLPALVNGGFDVLSLANNHSTDCGQAGLTETMNNLEASGIRWCGAGTTREDATSVTILEIKGIKIGFVGFSEFVPDPSSSNPAKAAVGYATEESVRLSVFKARKQADVIIASFHWGAEYSSRPREREIRLAQSAVEAGADLVLGHGPHVLQGLQTIVTTNDDKTRRSLVAYSLGNFVFDSPRVWDRRLNQTIALECTFNRFGLVRYETVPLMIEGYRPGPAMDSEAKAILTRLDKLSAELNGKNVR